jgi:putative chitinase
MISTAQMRQFAPHLGPQGAETWARALSTALTVVGVSTNREIRHFMAQVSHESQGFARLEENLNYTAGRAHQIWPRRFPKPATFAAGKQRLDPKQVAITAYGGRMGNAPAPSEDGWKFRGRGPKMITGADNYRAFNAWAQARRVGSPHFMTHPHMLATPAWGAMAAAWFWSVNGLSRIVAEDANENRAVATVAVKLRNEEDDLVQGTKRINGGTIGLADRRERLRLAMQVWP